MHKLFLFFVLSIFMASAQTRMSEGEAHILETKVKNLAATTKTIVSDFKQYKHMDFLSNDIESTGKLMYKAPDLVKWEYVEPFAYSVLFKDETLYINNEGEKSNIDIGSNKLFKQLNRLITDSVKGDMFDAQAFTISYFKKGPASEVHFAPLDSDFSKFIKEFQLVFNDKGEVMEVKMVEPSNDYTQIVFLDRKSNLALSDAVFAN